MKRIHLYRGKRLDNDQFIEGSLIGEDVIVGKIVDFEEDYFTTEFWYRVDPNTICQFTGETDSNGTLIFDGDIVSDATGMTYIVFWDDKGQWCASDEFCETELLSDIITDTTTVIGNIHDNKELLK